MKKSSLLSCLAGLMLFLLTTISFAAPPLIMGYYTNWSVYDTTHANPYPGNAQKQSNQELLNKLSKINAVAYAFLEVNSNGSVYFNDPWSDLSPADVNWCKTHLDICFKPASPAQYGWGDFDAFANPDTVKNIQYRIISIGGYGHTQNWQYAIAKPTIFAQSIVEIAKQFKINGVDLDAEPLDQLDVPGFLNLAKILRQTLNDNGFNDFIITFPVSVNQNQIKSFGMNNWKALISNINYIGLMGYDMHGEFDVPPITNLQSQLYLAPGDTSGFSDDAGVKALESMDVPANKIILGVPAYSRTVSEVQDNGLQQTFGASYKGDLDAADCSTPLGQGNTCGGMESYRGLETLGILNKAKDVQKDDALIGAYANDDAKNFFSFDDPKTIASKIQYVKQNGLAGTLIWSLNSDVPVSDSQSLIAAIANDYQ